MHMIYPRILTLSVFVLVVNSLVAQNPLAIPPAITGPVFFLNCQPDSTEFYPGHQTPTFGVNRHILAPTLILNKDETVTLNVTNYLPNTTTTMHWHGLHVPAAEDGGPHQNINPGDTWSPTFKVMNDAATYWYHPHGQHKTDIQVSKGMAGLIIVRDSLEAALTLPRTYGVDDFPVILQSKCFDVLYQIAIATAFDTVPMVNATIDPYLDAPAQVVRLRVLNGASERSFMLGFSNGMSFHQIATDGGLMQTPFSTTSLLVSPGERAEILVDLSGLQGQTVNLMNLGTQIPNGVIGAATVGAGMAQIPDYNLNPLNGSDYQLLQINVVAPTLNPVTTIPSTLVPFTPWNPASADYNRTITFAPTVPVAQGMVEGPFAMNGHQFDMSVIDDTVYLDNVEKWTLVNQTLVAHPFHIHDVQFYVTDVNGTTPPPHMQGKKDVVLVDAQATVSFITKFEDFAGTVPYMYHCHLLHHEDDGMMGSFIVLDSTTTAITEIGSEEIEVYPNPSSGEHISIQLKKNEVMQYSISDLRGSVLLTGKSDFSDESKIDIRSLERGIYLLQLRGEKSNYCNKIIRQ